jgi:hypothetical protein
MRRPTNHHSLTQKAQSLKSTKSASHREHMDKRMALKFSSLQRMVEKEQWTPAVMQPK